MTITLIDLYNTAASQEWAMYDNDATTQTEIESSLVIALNKAITEILYSYPFSFRERTHMIFTLPRQNVYDIPNGNILSDSSGNYKVKLNASNLMLDNSVTSDIKGCGIPQRFNVAGNKIILEPTPEEKYIITIDYETLAIGEDADGNEIYALKKTDDSLFVPEHLEEIFKNAVISRAMLNSIASESDENYSAYKKQSETAYRLLIKYSKGLNNDKKLKV